MATVQTCRGPVEVTDLGPTLIHEHLFVRSFELEVNDPDPEWRPAEAVETAVRGLDALYELGIRTVVDLTVPGLGRDVALVAEVARRTRVQLIASTGWYTDDVLPIYFRFHGPGRVVDGTDPLVRLFLTDIERGIAGTGIRAAMLKVMSDAPGITPDVARVMTAAAFAHGRTGIPITTHSQPASRNGLEQQAFLTRLGVPPERIVIGHSGDSEDLDYLKTLMDRGSTVGMDRFGMEQVLPDEARVRTVLALLHQGYGDRMVLAHDTAFYSHVTPPSWRARHAPNWRFDRIPRTIVPMLIEGGASDADVDRMLVTNPRRLLAPSAASGPAVDTTMGQHVEVEP